MAAKKEPIWNPKFHNHFAWVVAFDAFDHGAREPLAHLIENGELPDELRPALAKIISGERVPNLKAASKLKVSAKERLMIAAQIATIFELIDDFRTGDNFLSWDDEGNAMPPDKLINIVADQRGVEPIQVVNLLREKKRIVVEKAIKSLGVKRKTVYDLVEAYNEKMRNYPNI